MIGGFGQITEINPLVAETSFSALLVRLVYSSLVQFTADGEIVPDLATSWNISADKKVWSFSLRKDVTFHNGEPLTAQDIKYTYEKAAELGKMVLADHLKILESINVKSPHEIEFVLKSFNRNLWVALGQIGIVSHKIYDRDIDIQGNYKVGSGPFKLITQGDKEVIFEPNQDYYGGRPYLDKVILKLLPDQATILNYLIAEKVDMAFLISPKDYGSLEKIPHIRVYDNWFPVLYMLVFNINNDLFRSPVIRRALSLAIDKNKILQRVFKNKGYLVSLPWDVKAKVPEDHTGYRPQEALALLQKDKWQDLNKDYILEKNGKNLQFEIVGIDVDNSSTEVLQNLQEQLREIGMKVSVSLLPYEDFVEKKLRTQSFDIALFFSNYRPYFEKRTFASWHSSQISKGLNFGSYHNKEVDSILEKLPTVYDEAELKKLQKRLLELLEQDPPGVFLFWRPISIAVHKRFRGVPEKDMSSFGDIKNFWVPKAEQRAND